MANVHPNKKPCNMDPSPTIKFKADQQDNRDMETGYMNLHDEEHFSNSFYNESTDLETNDDGLFGGIMGPDLDYGTEQFDPLPILWDAVDSETSSVPVQQSQRKEDFQKMLTDWQDLTNLQEPEVYESHSCITTVGDLFPNTSSSQQTPAIWHRPEVHTVSSSSSLLDDLFAYEIKQESVDLGIHCIDMKEESSDIDEKADYNAVPVPPEASDVSPRDLVNDDCVDIETLSEADKQIPSSLMSALTTATQSVLEARDLSSLLEQFEASEVFNEQGAAVEQKMSDKKIESLTEITTQNNQLNNSTQINSGATHYNYKLTKENRANTDKSTTDCSLKNKTIQLSNGNQLISKNNTLIDQKVVGKQISSPQKAQIYLTHQHIRDSLPIEVIERIKASAQKKPVPVIPAKPSKKQEREANRTKDVSVPVSRNKVLKVVTGSVIEEIIQLDHDYCSGADTTGMISRSFYHADILELTGNQYYRLPDYKGGALAPNRVTESERWVEKNSRKDSGLESGEVSDASEDSTVIKPGPSLLRCAKPFNPNNSNHKVKERKVLHMVSVLKKPVLNQDETQSRESETVTAQQMAVDVFSKTIASEVVELCSNKSVSLDASTRKEREVSTITEVDAEIKKKRKLNLEEYRSRRERIRSEENSRTNSPVGSVVSITESRVGENTTPDSTSFTKISKTKTTRCLVTTAAAQGRLDSEGVAELQKKRPVMKNVEVQTQTMEEELRPAEKVRNLDSKTSRYRNDSSDRRCHRENRKRQYRVRRDSSSSSSSNDRVHSSANRLGLRRESEQNKQGAITSSRSRKWSRSNSRSSISNCSTCSSVDRSRSRSRSHSRSHRTRGLGKLRRRHQSPSLRQPLFSTTHHRYRHRDNSLNSQIRVPPNRTKPALDWGEKQRQVEERRVIYVGRIEEGTTKSDLRQRFQIFGPIVDISVHFRERGDNYGFVTFGYKVDAYEAIEHGNDDPRLPHYDLCFGGRRAFCKQKYADLDGLNQSLIYNGYHPQVVASSATHPTDSFDLLLRQAQSKLSKRSSV